MRDEARVKMQGRDKIVASVKKLIEQALFDKVALSPNPNPNPDPDHNLNPDPDLNPKHRQGFRIP